MKEPFFKKCIVCGSICGEFDSEFEVCPKEDCGCKIFQSMTLSELKNQSNDGKITVYFRQWPSWPDSRAWVSVFEKEKMEKSPKTKPTP